MDVVIHLFTLIHGIRFNQLIHSDIYVDRKYAMNTRDTVNAKTVLHLLEEWLTLPSVLYVRCHYLLEADIAALGKPS